MHKSDGEKDQRQWQTLMDAAAARLQIASHDDSEIGQCARRVIQTPAVWRTWELEFGASIRPVARFRHRSMQVRGLRQAGFAWIHLAAPFRHIRNHQLRGEQRRKLVLGMHSQYTFARAMVAEHGVYLRSICHSLCAVHVGQAVLGDLLYGDSMRRYEALYTEYFKTYCAATYPKHSADVMGYQALLPLLKKQTSELRQAILDYPLRVGWLQREAAIRQPTGDTQRLRLFGQD